MQEATQRISATLQTSKCIYPDVIRPLLFIKIEGEGAIRVSFFEGNFAKPQLNRCLAARISSGEPLQNRNV